MRIDDIKAEASVIFPRTDEINNEVLEDIAYHIYTYKAYELYDLDEEQGLTLEDYVAAVKQAYSDYKGS